MRKPRTTIGDFGLAALAQIRACALAGDRAPSHAAIAEVVGCSTSFVQKEINAMIRAGLLSMRIDLRCSYRRAYWIIGEDLKTEGFDEGLPLDAVRSTVTKEIMLAQIAQLAAAGSRAPTFSEWALALSSYPGRVRDMLGELFTDGVIEVRRLAGCHERAYRIAATGQATAGFEEGRAVTPFVKDAYHKPEFDRAKPVRKSRACITCQSEFMSEGAHNRMCSECRSTAEPDAVFRVVAI